MFDVAGKSTFLLEMFGEAHINEANINFLISFYDKNNDLIGEGKKFYVSVPKDTDKVLFGKTPPQMIPVNAKTAVIAMAASCLSENEGAGFQFAYIGMEME